MIFWITQKGEKKNLTSRSNSYKNTKTIDISTKGDNLTSLPTLKSFSLTTENFGGTNCKNDRTY